MTDAQQDIFDVVIVGAGPAGLASLSAIQTPFSYDRFTRAQAERVERSSGFKNYAKLNVCVVDTESWLGSWKRNFRNLDIQWLRSPVSAHPDCYDSTSLLGFAFEKERKNEMLDTGIHEQNQKHVTESDLGLRYLPSSNLFEEFCSNLIKLLPHTIKTDFVRDVTGEDGNFLVHLGRGGVLRANRVVLAIGMAGPPAMPLRSEYLKCTETKTFQLFNKEKKDFPSLAAQDRVLVIGGGLTAVQAVQKAAKHGCNVVLMSRRPIRTKHLDIGTREAVNPRYKNEMRYKFLESPIHERAKAACKIRDGGSVPRIYMETLELLEERGQVKRVVKDYSSIIYKHGIATLLDNGTELQFDWIISACGFTPDCLSIPLIQRLHSQWPAELADGFPVLNNELQWPGLENLYVLGSLSTLQVGPDAGNLSGIRVGAKTIAEAMGLRDWLYSIERNDNNILGNKYGGFISDSSSEADSDDDSELCF